jgi:hypothetical protein
MNTTALRRALLVLTSLLLGQLEEVRASEAPAAGVRLLQLTGADEVLNGKSVRRQVIEIEWPAPVGAAATPFVSEVRVDGKKVRGAVRCVVSDTGATFAGELTLEGKAGRLAGTWHFSGTAEGSEGTGTFFSQQGEVKRTGSGTLLSVHAEQRGGTALRVWFPQEATPVRGLFIWGNGAECDDRGKVFNERWRAFCRAHNLAFVATSNFGNAMGGGAGKRLQKQLALIAARSGHSEINDAPVIFSGHSNGGQMAWEFNAAFPGRTIAISVSKGGYYLTRDYLAQEACQTPALMVIGGEDTPERGAAIARLMAVHPNRAKPWGLVVERGVGHQLGHSEDVWLPFFAWAMEQRGSAEASGKLRPVDLKAGWVADSRSGGFKPAREVSDKAMAGSRWFPTPGVMLACHALANYDPSLVLSAGSAKEVLPVGGTLLLRAKRPAGEWSGLELWIDGVRRRIVKTGDLAVDVKLEQPGVYSAVVIGRRADGRTVFSAPLAWIVQPVSSETGFGPQAGGPINPHLRG